MIRATTNNDLESILAVHADAFGPEEGPEIVELVRQLLEDETARPVLSLIADVDGTVAAHVLFTTVSVHGGDREPLASLLAPLAVASKIQGQGLGTRLVHAGLEELRASGVELVFVLGHPDYYPRFGFRPAGALGFAPPYAIPEKNADAWMVAEIRAGVVGTVHGTVECAAVLQDEKYWRE